MNLAYTMFNKFWKNKFIITVLKSNDINDLIRCLNRLNIYNKVMTVNIDLENYRSIFVRKKQQMMTSLYNQWTQDIKAIGFL